MNHYTGVTAYVKNTPDTQDRFRVLAELMFQLQPYVYSDDSDTINLSPYSDILASSAAQLVLQNERCYTKHTIEFPVETPKNYQSVELTSHEAGEQFFTRLYVPVITDHGAENIVQNGLRPVLIALFGDDLVNIKTKTGTNLDLFDLLPENVLLSAARTRVVDL